jgi:sec-independent protein translocase protein TatB
MMANLGMADTLILMVLALVVFGPRRLPQIGRQIGKLMYEFRKASNDFKFQMEEELRNAEEADRRKKDEEQRQRALAAAPPPAQLEQGTGPAVESPIATPYLETPDAAAESPAVTAESPSSTSEPAATTHAPAPPASIAAESPYANESGYPDFFSQDGKESHAETAAESPAESSAHSEPAPTAAPEAALPRIQPPSTGEKIAAERPGARPAQNELFADDAGKVPENAAPEAERSEPATHHG